MPVYLDLPTFDYYPDPEKRIRQLHHDIGCRSMLDVGSGHGGVFDLEYWTKRDMTRRVASDLFWMREMPPGWGTMTGVDAQKLPFQDREFDFVQCCEVLEHVPDPRKALEELVRVANKMVFITSADEMHHIGEEQERIEKINPHQKFLEQPKVSDLFELGFEIRVETTNRRQLIAWKYL